MKNSGVLHVTSNLKKISKAAKTALLILLCAVLILPANIFCFAAGINTDAVTIAVIDTGISAESIPEEAMIAGRNFANANWDTSDRIGHGTKVAYLINSVAPDAMLIPLVWYDKYLSGVKASGTAEIAAQAICAAVDDYHADIINISSGISEENDALKAAVEYALEKGSIIVSAAGNDNLSSPEKQYYPASWDGVIGVGAWDDKTGTQAAFSQRQGADILACGVDIETRDNQGRVVYVSGSSFAAAVVSGNLAMWMSRASDRSFADVKNAFLDACYNNENYGLMPAIGSLFCDIADGTELAESVSEAYRLGIINGTSKALFSPGLTLTRGMAATIFWRMEGSPSVMEESQFTDVPDGAYYEQSVIWAETAGLIKGTGDGRCLPDKELTWTELALICMRYKAYRMGTYPALLGVGPDWAEGAAEWAVSENIFDSDVLSENKADMAVSRGDGIIAVMRLSDLHI